MKSKAIVFAFLSCVTLAGVLCSTNAKASPSQDKLEAAGLKSIVEGLGYETKALNAEVGKEKYEFSVKVPDFNVPISAEISSSTNYIWLTVFLGVSKPTLSFEDLLRKNSEIQPSQFYITAKGNLMLAIAIDNRQVNAAVLRRNVDKIAEDVSGTSKLWSGK